MSSTFPPYVFHSTPCVPTAVWRVVASLGIMDASRSTSLALSLPSRIVLTRTSTTHHWADPPPFLMTFVKFGLGRLPVLLQRNSPLRLWSYPSPRRKWTTTMMRALLLHQTLMTLSSHLSHWPSLACLGHFHNLLPPWPCRHLHRCFR